MVRKGEVEKNVIPIMLHQYTNKIIQKSERVPRKRSCYLSDVWKKYLFLVFKKINTLKENMHNYVINNANKS